MSIRAMNWAWQAPLPPAPKIVLLALADIADDDGVCWPGHRSLALKCSTTVRTIQRTIAALAAQGRLLIEPRYRHDGSRSSNRYRLPIETPHDKLSWGGDTGVVGPPTPVSWPPDTGVVPRTTKEPLLDTPQLDEASTLGRVVVDNSECIFPTGLTAAQRAALQRRLVQLPTQVAQLILDELAGRMQLATVRNPVGYCATLIRRSREGSFEPELAQSIADRRLQCEPLDSQPIEPEATAPGSGNGKSDLPPGPLRDALDRVRRRTRTHPHRGRRGDEPE